MKSQDKDQITDMLKQYDDARAKSEREENAAAAARDAFPARFNDLARNVVRPALEEVRQRIIESGHDADIEFVEEPARQDRHTHGSVTLYFIAKGWTPAADRRRVPKIAFTADQWPPEINVTYDAVGESGPFDKIPIDRVTREAIQERAIAALKKLVLR
jgi:hypothetical protein